MGLGRLEVLGVDGPQDRVDRNRLVEPFDESHEEVAASYSFEQRAIGRHHGSATVIAIPAAGKLKPIACRARAWSSEQQTSLVGTCVPPDTSAKPADAWQTSCSLSLREAPAGKLG